MRDDCGAPSWRPCCETGASARLCGGLCGAGSWLFLEDASPDRCILRFKQLAKGNGALGIAWQIVNDVLGQRVEVLTYRLQVRRQMFESEKLHNWLVHFFILSMNACVKIGRASCRERVCQYV